MSAPKARGGRGADKPHTTTHASRLISDPRFAHAHTDPRFSRPRTAQHSFTPDARFSRMFSDAAFGSESKVDKWGRKVQMKGGERLKKFYGIGAEEGEEAKEQQNEEAELAEKKDGTTETMEQPGRKQKQSKREQHSLIAANDDRDEDDNGDDAEERTAESGEDEIEEDADDTYTQSYLSSRTVAPPSSDEDEDDADEDDTHDEPASPTFPNVLGSDSDSDIEPLYTQDDADQAADEQPDEHIEHGDATDTLALVNMDWDRLRAADIYMLCRSFAADSEGRVVGVTVYRSEYGKQRMAEEEKYGPIGLYGDSVAEYRERIDKKVREQMKEEQRAETASATTADKDEDDAKEENEEVVDGSGDEDEVNEQEDVDVRAAVHANNDNDDNETPLDQEKLRQYELSRLRYFYAIIRCSSTQAATALYTALDASEFESSANKLDLRFVPAGTQFDADDMRDECVEHDMDERAMTEYRAPAVFVTKALQHSRVELTWDADDEVRKRKLKAGAGGSSGAAKKGKGKGKKAVDMDEGEDDLRVYLASDDDDDGYGSDAAVEAGEEGEEDRPVLKKKARARYTALLSEINGQRAADRAGGADGEVDNDDDDEDEGERVIEMTFEPGLKAKAEELVKRVTEREERKNETVFEKRAREARDKKKERKKQNRTTKHDNNDANDEDGDDEEGRKDEDEEDVVDVDMDDDFFKGAFDDDEYMPVGQRAKSFFADDERQERRDKKLNRENREEAALEAGGEDEDEDERKRQAELELLLLPNQPGEAETEGDKHYHLSQLVKANKATKPTKANRKLTSSTAADNDSEWHVDVSDPRFAAMYDRADYSIDPTHPAYKPTKEMERVMAERQRRRIKDAKQRELTVKQRKAQTAADRVAAAADGEAAAAVSGGGELDELVASVKAKTRARESELEQRKRKDAEVRKAAAGDTAGGKRLGEQPLQANNKKQKLKGDMRV